MQRYRCKETFAMNIGERSSCPLATLAGWRHAAVLADRVARPRGAAPRGPGLRSLLPRACRSGILRLKSEIVRDPVDVVRRFTRSCSPRIGGLGVSCLGRGMPLGPVRLL